MYLLELFPACWLPHCLQDKVQTPEVRQLTSLQHIDSMSAVNYRLPDFLHAPTSGPQHRLFPLPGTYYLHHPLPSCSFKLTFSLSPVYSVPVSHPSTLSWVGRIHTPLASYVNHTRALATLNSHFLPVCLKNALSNLRADTGTGSLL